MSELSEQQFATLLSAMQTVPEHSAPDGELARILDLPVTMRVELGRQRCCLREVIAMGSGKLLELNRGLEQPLEVRIGDNLFALGSAVVVGGKFGVEILALAPRAGPEPSPRP